MDYMLDFSNVGRKRHLTKDQWTHIYDVFREAGFTHKESVRAADEGFKVTRNPAAGYLAHRAASVYNYMGAGFTRAQAIRKASQDLARWNRKRGKDEDYIYSERYAR
jgi:hypothetical protein